MPFDIPLCTIIENEEISDEELEKYEILFEGKKPKEEVKEEKKNEDEGNFKIKEVETDEKTKIAEGFDKSINEKDPLASDTKEIPSALNGAEKIDNPLNKEENKDEEKAAEDAKKHVGQEDAKKVVSAEEATPEKKKGIFDKLKGNKQVDFIIGGPPCQAYSIVGRARDPKNMKKDPRNFLYKYYLQFLKRYEPKMFVFENVPGILSAQNGIHLENILKGIDKAGYKIELKKLKASDYGVLQNRERVIIVGWRKELNLKYPELEKEENPYKILPDLFSDLPERQQGEGSLTDIVQYVAPATGYLQQSKVRNSLDFTTQHIARPHNLIDLEIYKRAIKLWLEKKARLNYADLPPELQKHNNKQAFLNRFQVVNHEGCCHTVVAHIAMDGHYYIYPSLKQIRSITVREAARIQSFPDDYYFEGSRTAAFKQIGNAVPVILAEKIANKIKEQFTYEL